MNDQLTIKELLELCKKQVKAGNGDKHIVISDDNEGNGYHGMFFGFTECSEDFQDLIYDSNYKSKEDAVILG